MKNGSKLTPVEATDLALKMKRQGFTYEKIADHLKDAGYLGSRKGEPIGAMMVRHMVTRREKEERDAEAQDKKEEAVAQTSNGTVKSGATEDKILVTTDASFKRSVQVIIANPEIRDDLKLRILKALADGQDKVTVEVSEYLKESGRIGA